MHAREMIANLERLIARHGDLGIVNEDDREIVGIEFNADDVECHVLVLIADYV